MPCHQCNMILANKFVIKLQTFHQQSTVSGHYYVSNGMNNGMNKKIERKKSDIVLKLLYVKQSCR